MKILALHDGHNASAAFLENGEVISAVQEERLSRHKNQGEYPDSAVNEVLRIANCNMQNIDYFVFCGLGVTSRKMRDDVMDSYQNKFNPNRYSILKSIEKKIRDIRDSLFPERKLRQKEERLKKKQGQRMQPLLKMGVDTQKIHFIDHHLCHAATAYYGQENMKDNILVLTCDGAGDYLSASVMIGKNGRLKKLDDIPQADSVPILYSFVTYLLGFMPLEHEYKLMGLAPYAEGAKQSQDIRDYFKSLFYFTDEKPLGWVRSKGIPSTFSMGPALTEALQFKRFDQIAGGLQSFIEEFFIEWVKRAIAATDIHKLALSGGLFMNVKLNKRIMELPEVESLYVFPSCGDESNSVGAGWVAHSKFTQDKDVKIPSIGPIYWGANYSSDEVDKALDQYQFRKKRKLNT